MEKAALKIAGVVKVVYDGEDCVHPYFKDLIERAIVRPLPSLSEAGFEEEFDLQLTVRRRPREQAVQLMVHLEQTATSTIHGDVVFPPGYAGTRGEGRRLEGFQVIRCPFDLKLEYTGHVAQVGDIAADPTGYLGTKGHGLALEGFTVRLPEEAKGKYSLKYMAHLKNIGDTEWKGEGDFCGTKGESRRIEGIEIKICEIDSALY